MKFRTLLAFFTAAAVVRPIFTVATFGGIDQLAAEAVHQVSVDLAVAVAFTVATEKTVNVVGEAGLKALFTRIFAQFYLNRLTVLSGIIETCLPEANLSRIRRLAGIKDGESMVLAWKTSERLRELLGIVGGGTTTTEAVHVAAAHS